MIENFIPKGKENAISRTKLSLLTGKSDRTNRAEIEKARKKSIPIMSTSQGKGYWISDNIDEIKAYVSEQDRRIKEMQHALSGFKKIICEHDGIKMVKVREHLRRISN